MSIQNKLIVFVLKIVFEDKIVIYIPNTVKGSYRRRRRKDDDKSDYHHTFVMKLFDKSVDLAQFNQTNSLYPVCR